MSIVLLCIVGSLDDAVVILFCHVFADSYVVVPGVIWVVSCMHIRFC